MNFSAQVVEPLTYDFTGFRSNTGKGTCAGKGTIPEPTQDSLKAYAESLQTLFGLGEDADASKEIEQVTGQDRQRKLLELTAELCQQQPSADELEELPPRILGAFMKWVYQELSDPEVSSGATPL